MRTLALGAPLRRTLAAIALLCAAAWGTPAAADPAESECARLSKAAMALTATAEKTGDVAKAREAMELLERAQRLCPDDPQPIFEFGLAAVVARDADRANGAVDALHRVLAQWASEPGATPAEPRRDPRSLYLRALIHATFGSSVKNALELLQTLRSIDPTFMHGAVVSLEFHCRTALAAQLLHLRPPSDAERQAAQGLAVNQAKLAVDLVRGQPLEAVARRNLAQVYRAVDEWVKSEEEFKRLVDAYPRDAVLRYAYASVLADQHKYEEALAQWEAFLRVIEKPDAIDPREADTVADARMRYGVSLVHLSREAEGLAQLRAYVERHPEDARGWYYLGRTAKESDTKPDPDEAIRCLTKAHELDRWCEGSLQLLRQLYTFERPDPVARAKIDEILENPAIREKMKQEMDRRKTARPDGTNGCE